MGEAERISTVSRNAFGGDAEAARHTIAEQAAEIDALRQHMLAAAGAVNGARSQAEDARRELQQACAERAQAWEENERLRAELHSQRAEFEALRAEMERYGASRVHRLLLAYRRLYELPVLGPMLRLLRRSVGRLLRLVR